MFLREKLMYVRAIARIYAIFTRNMAGFSPTLLSAPPGLGCVLILIPHTTLTYYAPYVTHIYNPSFFVYPVLLHDRSLIDEFNSLTG